MEIFITRTIESFIFPPGCLLILLVLGLWLLKRSPSIGRGVIASAVVVGYLLSTPMAANWLLSPLQHYPALSDEALQTTPAQAIVVLASGRYRQAAEYGGEDTVGDGTLVRIRYGAYLHHKTGLPVVVSGGTPMDPEDESLARLMADTLTQEFGVKEVWLEDKSCTTAENAIYSQKLLAEKGIDTALLVTQAWHMPRSVDIFEQVGMTVIPAPTRFIGVDDGGFALSDILPSAGAMDDVDAALHEWVGRLWYLIRH